MISTFSEEDGIEARLRAPERRLDLSALRHEWSTTRITLALAQPLPDDPGIGTALRGALGRALMRCASREAISGRACPWQPPCALDPFFVPRRAARGGERPKPMVLHVQHRGTGCFVHADLFGFAANWAEPVADALVAALRGGLGPAPRVEVETLRRSIHTEPPSEPLPPAKGYVLTFLTPLVLDIRKADVPTAKALLAGLLTRVEGLAAWHDVSLEFDRKRIGDAIYGAQLNIDAARPYAGRRVSARQERAIPVSGWTGELLLTGDLSGLEDLLVIGEATGAGGFAVAGFGRYRLGILD